MQQNLVACMDFVLRAEGGFVDDPRDNGHATNRGITLATLTAWRGHACSVQDMRDLSVQETAAIYKARYWDKVRGDDLPAGVDLAVVDFAVNAGWARSAEMLQKIVGVPVDGVIGPVTLAAAAKVAPLVLIARLADAQEAYYRSLTTTFPVFGKGWLNRTAARRAAAVALLNQPAPALQADPASPLAVDLKVNPPTPAPSRWVALFAAVATLFRRHPA